MPPTTLKCPGENEESTSTYAYTYSLSKVSRPFFPTVTNGSSEASSLQSKQVVLDVIDILHVLQLFLTYIISKHKKCCYVIIKT